MTSLIPQHHDSLAVNGELHDLWGVWPSSSVTSSWSLLFKDLEKKHLSWCSTSSSAGKKTMLLSLSLRFPADNWTVNASWDVRGPSSNWWRWRDEDKLLKVTELRNRADWWRWTLYDPLLCHHGDPGCSDAQWANHRARPDLLPGRVQITADYQVTETIKLKLSQERGSETVKVSTHLIINQSINISILIQYLYLYQLIIRHKKITYVSSEML